MRDPRRDPGRQRRPVHDPWKNEDHEQRKNRQLLTAILAGLGLFIIFSLVIAQKLMKSKEEDVANILKGRTDARLTFLQGEVQILRKSTGQWEKGETNTILNEGDSLDTGPSERSVLAISDVGDSVRLARKSVLEIGKLYKDKTTGKVGGNLFLENGRIWIKIKNAEKFDLKTPWGRISTAGSSFEVRNDQEERNGDVIVWGGSIELDWGREKLVLDSGKMVRIVDGNIQPPEEAGRLVIKDDWEKWNEALTAQENAPLPPEPRMREEGKNIFDLPRYPDKKPSKPGKTATAPAKRKKDLSGKPGARPEMVSKPKSRPQTLRTPPRIREQSQFQIQAKPFEEVKQNPEDIWQINSSSSNRQAPQPVQKSTPRPAPVYTPPPQTPPPPTYRPTSPPTPQPTVSSGPPRVPGFDLGAPPVGPAER